MIPPYITELVDKPLDVTAQEDLRLARAEITLQDVADGVPAIDNVVNVWNCEGTTTLRKGLAVEGQAVDVRNYAEKTLKAMKNILSRNGVDGKGMAVHVNINYGKNHNNAFWNGTELVLGTGDQKTFNNFALSPEVFAHEIAHGLVHHSAKLNYKDDSGAINEHFSDVFGLAMQRQIETSKPSDWLIGNEIVRFEGEALRSLAFPGTAYDNPVMGVDPQPSHMSQKYRGFADHGGVHINSGILNKVYYLVAKEIGAWPACRMWYEVLLSFTGTPDATFDDFKTSLIKQSQRPQRAGWPQLVRWACAEVGL